MSDDVDAWVRGAAACLGRGEGSGFRAIASCFAIRIEGAPGAFLGARHYLASNDITEASTLAIRGEDGVVHPVIGWDLEQPDDLALFHIAASTEDVGFAPLALDPVVPPDGTDLVLGGYPLDRDGSLLVVQAVVTGPDTIQLDGGLSFEGYYVECEARDGMSGGPAVSPSSGKALAIVSGVQPDWAIAALCPVRLKGPA